MKKRKNKRRAKLIIFIIVTLLIDLGLAYKIAMMCQDVASDEELMDTLQPALQEEFKVEAKEVPVLTYHNIGSDDVVAAQGSDDNWISESNFREHMEFLAVNGYTTLTVDEFYMWQQGEIRVPEKSVLITFDDGAYNVIRYACPVLRDLGLSATAFVRGEDTPDKTDKKSDDGLIGMDVLTTIEEDWPELQIQSQTYALNAENINKMNEEQLVDDCEKQDEKFEEAGLYFVYVSNPYGKTSKDMISALEDMGYIMVFTADDGKKATRKDNEFKIPRITIKGNVSADDAFDGWPVE